MKKFLERYPDSVSFKQDDFIGNPGETTVCPLSPLPATVDRITDEILTFCRTEKTKAKIEGKFRRHGTSEVALALQHLLKAGKLVTKKKGKQKCYVAY